MAIAGADARGTWEQLEVLMINWRRLEVWVDQPGPLLYSITRTGTPRPISLN